MRTISSRVIVVFTTIAVAATAVGTTASRVQDKYNLKIPGGLAFSEFRGYESWEVISVSHNGPLLAVILGNRAMIDAYKAGIPGNGKPFPDGAKMAKIHWVPKKQESMPGQPLTPDIQKDVDFMLKDSRRFSDSGGWGYAVFRFDATTGSFAPGAVEPAAKTTANHKCGLACHTIVKANDYVFTSYASR